MRWADKEHMTKTRGQGTKPMKTTVVLTVVTSILYSAMLYAGAAQDYQIVDKGAHHRRLEKTTARTHPDGTMTTEKEGYIELASGMHYKGQRRLDRKPGRD